jgi:16S rRNA (guanine1207-N2)-methyltransferase
MERALAGRDRANRMFDAYGALLTPQQQRLLRRYYQDDLSLGEIAAQMRITRQAVHDGLRRALAAMERFEAALGLADGGEGGGGRGRAGSAEHYFASAPRSPKRPRLVRVTLRGRSWTFQTAGGVFARRGLDAGTRLLIETMQVSGVDRVLDLGCGYGAIGLVAAALAPRGRVWMIDANQRAAALAQANAAENRIGNVVVLARDSAAAIRDGSMDVVVTNPPIRAGRRAVAAFVDDAWRALRPGGRFYLVARTAQGAQTLSRLIASRFGDVRQASLAHGYRVYEAIRTRARMPEVHATV